MSGSGALHRFDQQPDHGEDVLVADDPQAFADAVVRLYEDEALWNALARSGLDSVARNFSLEAARDTVHRVFL